MITQKELKELLMYNPNTGIFTWKTITSNRVKAGEIAGTMHRDGYSQIKINGKFYRAPRLAWLYVYGEWPDKIDHINHIRNDNRINNLRSVSNLDNSRNQKMRKNNTSGITGVSRYKEKNKWEAYIWDSGKKIHLGHYTNKDEAIKIRKQAEILYGYHPNHGK
jgi:hypothetical protein